MAFLRRALVFLFWAVVWSGLGLVAGLLLDRAARNGALKGRAKVIGAYLASVPDRLLGPDPSPRPRKR